MSTQTKGCYYTAASSVPNGASNPIVAPKPVDSIPMLFINNGPPHKFHQNTHVSLPPKCNKTGYKTIGQTGKQSPSHGAGGSTPDSSVHASMKKVNNQFVSHPNFQAMISPRFDNSGLNSSIRYNIPDRRHLGAPANPFGDF